MKDLYLLFNTYYVDEEGIEGVYHCWVYIPARHNDGVSTDEQFIAEVYKQQAPIFEGEGLTIQEVTLERKSEFEYKLYEKENRDKVKYHNAKMRARGWNY